MNQGRFILLGMLLLVLVSQCLLAADVKPAPVAPAVVPPAAPPLPPIKAEVKAVGNFTYISHECVGPYTNFPQAEKAFLGEFKASKIKATGAEIALYWNSPLFVKPEQLKWEIGYPVAPNTRNTGKMVVKKFPFNKVAAALHVGPYTTTYQTVNALYAWIAANKLATVGGPCVERYLDSDPDKVPDARKKTEILIPIK